MSSKKIENHYSTVECQIPPRELNASTESLCQCLETQYNDQPWPELPLHREVQDTGCTAWLHLLELIEEAAKDGRRTFSPAPDMVPQEWQQIVTLPATISKLQAVEELLLYGSALMSLPPEIGDMTNLREFTPYCSYQLHWFPYEITRCKQLKMSTVSTRALYGNSKYYPPFPSLPQAFNTGTPSCCSICHGAFGERGPELFWVSLEVATDVLPLLVHACSRECLNTLPKSPEGYLPCPHQGGLAIERFISLGAAALPAVRPIVKANPTKEAIPVLQAAVKQQNDLAADALGEMGALAKEAVPDLIALETQASTSALGKIGGGAAVAELIQRLNSKDMWVRFYAAESLGAFKTDAVTAALLATLANDDDTVSRGAGESLLAMGPDVADKMVGTLKRNIQCLAPEGSGIHDINNALHIRAEAAEFMGRINRPEFVPLLIPLLSDADTVYFAAGRALNAINTPEAMDALIAEVLVRIESDDEFVRHNSIRLAGSIGRDELIPALKACLKGSDQRDQTLAEEALKLMGSIQ
jgi:HEAT repeat protein